MSGKKRPKRTKPSYSGRVSARAELVNALDLAIPQSYDLEAKKEALRLGRELLRGTKYEEES
jgi:hypothetical protein